MTNQPQESQDTDLFDNSEYSETEVDKEEVSSAKDLIGHFARTTKTIKIYLPNNPMYQKFLSDLFDRFKTHLDTYGELRLRIRQYEMALRGEVVYENSNSLESLSFKMYVDGLRELTFGEGLELEEISDFLEIISRKYDPDDPDDDIVTLLWEQRLPHINYVVSEDFISETVEGTPVTEPGGIETMSRREMKSGSTESSPVETSALLQQTLGVQLPEGKLSPIFSVTDDEISRIKSEMKREEETSSTVVLLRILIQILRTESTDEGFQETISIMEKLLKTLVERGDFLNATRIVRLYHELNQAETDLTQAQRGSIKESIRNASNTGLMDALHSILDKTDWVEGEQVFEFSRLLGPDAVNPLIDLVGRLTRVKPRRILCDVLGHLCQNNITPLLRGLEDNRWFVVRNVLFVLTKIGNPKALDHVRPLVGHKETRVRRELIHMLEGIKEPKAKDLLVLFLQDPDQVIRVQALRALAGSGYEPALDRMIEGVSSRDFGLKESKEKKEWFEALGRLGGNSGVGHLREILSNGARGWFRRTAKEEMAKLSIEALRRIGSEEAQAVLVEFQQGSRKDIQEACAKALKDLLRKGNGR